MGKRMSGEGSWDKRTINGHRYFRYRKKYGNQNKEFYGKTKAEVVEKIQKYENSNQITSKESNILLKDFMWDWLVKVRINEVGDSSYTSNLKTYKYTIKNHTISNMKIKDIKPQHVQEWVNSLTQRIAKNSIAKHYYLLRGCFRYAIIIGLLTDNPCNGVSLPGENIVVKKRRVISYLNASELEILCNEIEATKEDGITPKHSMNMHFIIILAYTGLRIGELMALTWDDIDFATKTLHVRHTIARKTDITTGKEVIVVKEPKYNSVRDVPLADRAINSLKLIKSKSQSDKVVTITSISIRKNMLKLMKELGIEKPNFGLHALRHTFGSVLLEKGVDLKVISDLLGHKNIAVTANVYVNVSSSLARKSIEVLNKS